MSFEEIQSIWESQRRIDNSLDKDALYSWIQSRNRSFTRVVGVVEIVMTLTLLFVAMMFMKDPVLEGHDRILILAGIASMIAAGFVWSGRIARKKREVSYDSSLLGIVQKSIDAVDYQIKRMRSFLWWFAGPMSLGLLIGLFIIDSDRRYLLYTIFIPAFAICMLLTYWQIQREVEMKLLPEKKRLERLRDQICLTPESSEQD